MDLRWLNRNAAAGRRARERFEREGVNMCGQRLWSDADRQLIKLHSPDYDLLCALFPHRTRTAIRAQAKNLGVARPIHCYKMSEISKLRSMYKHASWPELLAAFPFANRESLRKVAEYHGFRRARKPYKPTGKVAIDQLLVKCVDVNMRLQDLDDECRTKRYFHKQGWRRDRPNYNLFVKAIEYLEGRVEVAWPREAD